MNCTDLAFPRHAAALLLRKAAYHHKRRKNFFARSRLWFARHHYKAGRYEMAATEAIASIASSVGIPHPVYERACADFDRVFSTGDSQ